MKILETHDARVETNPEKLKELIDTAGDKRDRDLDFVLTPLSYLSNSMKNLWSQDKRSFYNSKYT